MTLHLDRFCRVKTVQELNSGMVAINVDDDTILRTTTGFLVLLSWQGKHLEHHDIVPGCIYPTIRSIMGELRVQK